ncbi:MAG: YIP1 family protein [Anaerolineae bacterium]|nr:YIP1 family protein [Anaerolineae bacterium]
MDFEDHYYQPAGQSLAWYEVWQEAALRPSVENFESLLRDPQASSSRALMWVAAASGVAAAIQSVIGAMVQAIFDTTSPFFNFTTTNSQGFQNTSTFEPAQTLIFGLICGVPLAMLFGMIVLVIGGGILNLIARMFGGQGTYDELVYLMAAYTAPIAIGNAFISQIPFVGLFSLVIAFYSFVLQVMAVKTVHQFGWGQAVATVLAPLVIVCGLVFCCMIALLGSLAGS